MPRHHFTKWLRRTCGANKINWVPRNPQEDELLQRLTGRNTRGQFYPLFMAYKKARFDIVNFLFEFGASLQDMVEDDGRRTPFPRRTMFQHMHAKHSKSGTPEHLSEVVQCAIANRSTNIISWADLDSILPHSSFLSSSSRRLWDAPEDVGYRRRDVIWRHSEGGSGNILHWNTASEEIGRLTKLWGAISKADQSQKHGVLGNENSCRRSDKSDFVLRAALFSNWPAVRCLLGMGFGPDGSGELQVYFPMRPSVTFPITPLDGVQWTSYVPDDHCSSTGLAFKRSNRAIEELLLERGGSQVCSRVYCLFTDPLLELWAITSISHKYVAIFLRFIFFYALGSGFFAAMIKVSHPMIATFVFWAWVILTGVFSFLIAIGWISSCYGVGRKTTKCSRHHVLVQLAFGGSRRVFWSAMLGYRHVGDSWTSALPSTVGLARRGSRHQYIELEDDV